MAYFDSPKNRALWEVELNKLRREKALRSQGQSGEAAVSHTGPEKDGGQQPTRVRTSYKELLEEARQEHLAARGGRAMRNLSHEKQKTKAEPVRTMSIGKGKS